MYFNRKNAEQKNWRMIKKGKHFLFGCSLVFAVGASLATQVVHADTAEATVASNSTTGEVPPTQNGAGNTYAAPAAAEIKPEVATTPAVPTTEPALATPAVAEQATPKAANKEALKKLVEEIKVLDKAGKTEESLLRLNTAFEQAQEVLANVEASQDQVDTALANLKEAVAQLATKEEKSTAVAAEEKPEVAEAKAEEVTEAATETATPAEPVRSRGKRDLSSRSAYRSIDGSLAEGEFTGVGVKQFQSVRYSVDGNKTTWTINVVPQHKRHQAAGLVVASDDTIESITVIDRGPNAGKLNEDYYVNKNFDKLPPMRNSKALASHHKLIGGGIPDSLTYRVVTNGTHHNLFARFATAPLKNTLENNGLDGTTAVKNRTSDFPTVGVNISSRLAPKPGVNNTYTQTNDTITVPTVASTDETLTGTGKPGATINIKVNGRTARQTQVAADGRWTFPLEIGLNSNVTGGAQLVPANKISVSQTVNGQESGDTDVNVSLGHSEILPSSKSKQQNNLVENDRNVTLKVPHDAGAAYFQFTDTNGKSQEVGLKRDAVPGKWQVNSSSSAIASVASSEDGKFYSTINLTLNKDMKAETTARVISNMQEGSYSSLQGWQTRNVEAAPKEETPAPQPEPAPQPQPEAPKPTTPAVDSATSGPEIVNDLAGKASTPADVTIKAPAGSTVKLYNKDGVVIGEAVANDQGVATIHPTNSLPEGEITATSTPAGGTESAKSAPITVTKTPTSYKNEKKTEGPYQLQMMTNATEVTLHRGDKLTLTGDAAGTALRWFGITSDTAFNVKGVSPSGGLDKNGSKKITSSHAKAEGTVAWDQRLGDTTITFRAEGSPNPTSNQRAVIQRTITVTVLETTKKYDPAAGTRVDIANPNNVSEDEKSKIINSVKTANPSLPAGSQYSVDEKGNLTITYPDKSTDKIAAAYLVTPAKDTTAPAKPEVKTDLTGKAGTKTPVEVNAEPGSKVELFDKDGKKIGEATAGKDGKATITPTVEIPEGNVTAKATDPSGNTSDASDPKVATDTTAPAKPEVKTDLTGKAGTKTPVEVNAEPGSKVELFDKDGKKIGEATAGKDGKATITPTKDIPAGNVTAKATDPAGNTSDASDPKVATDTTAPAKPVVNTDLTGKAGTKTPVEVNAEPGTKVELFDKDGNKIGEATAGKDGKATITPTVDIPEGNVTAKATDPSGNVSEPSEPAKATTPGKDTEAPAKPVVNTDLTGKAGTKTPVEVNAEPGTKVELFDKDGKKIGEATAGKDGKATITPTVEIPEGNVTAKATDPSGNVSEPSEPAKATTPGTEAPAKPVVNTDLTGKAGTKTPVEVNAEPGTKVELFDKDGNKIGEATAGKDGKATITPTVDIPEGNVTAKATDPSGNVSEPSEPAKATTPGKDTEAPAKPVVNTDLTGKAGTKTPVEVNAEPGTKVELFDKDGNKIGEATAGKDGKATITPTVDIPEGNVTAKATDPSGNVSEPSEPAKATTPGKDTEAPAKPVVNTDLTGKAGTKTPVEVNAEPGSKVELFDKDGKKIGEATAGKDGKATITPTKDIPAGNVTAKATDPAGNVSEPSEPAKATTPGKDTEAPAKPVVNTDLTGKAGTKTPVEVNAEPGSKVELFDKDGKKIGEATAGKDGKATITPTVEIPEGNVTAKATDPAGNTSDASDPKVATDTTAPAKPEVKTDLTGKAGTKTPVEVNAEPGSKVELFDKDGKKIGEATAGKDGKATITPTVDIPEGNVTAKATDPAGNTSDASDPKVATDTTAPAKPVVNTDLTGKAGTKTPVEVNAEPGTKVELFDKDGNKIGEATAGKDGKTTITPTVEIPAGNVTAKATDPSGNTSNASDPKVATDTTAPAKPVVNTDLTGKAGTKTPVEVNAEPGSKVELFDKDGKKIGEATAGKDGKTTITPTVEIPAGNVTAKATDPSGNTSNASDPKVATDTTAPAKPEVKTDLTGKAGTKTPVEVNAEPGSKVELFDKDGKKIGEATAGKDGKATITPTKDIPAGNVTAKATDPAGNVSEPSEPAKATTPGKDTEAPAKPVVNTDLTGKAGTKTPVEVNAEPGSKVELFDKDGKKIGEATAGKDGKATITPTKDIPAGNVTAKATDPAGNVSEPSEPAKATTPGKDTEAPAKPVVNTDLTGKAGTKTPVEVNAEPGTKVELFDKDGKKIGEATAGKDGKATITPTVEIPEGNVTAKATDPSGNVSEPSEPAKATTPGTEAPAKPVVNTDLTGKAGTKTPVEVNAEPGTKVELFDKDGNKIGEATAGKDGKATITPTVDIPEGNVTAKATDPSGNVSEPSEPAKATTPGKDTEAPAKPVVNTDLTGKAGTKTPVEVNAEPGTKVELFDKDGNKIGEATAGKDGKATITPTVDIPEGNVTAKATDPSGNVSEPSEPAKATTPGKDTEAPAKPVVNTDLTGKAGTKTPVEVNAEPGTKVELFDKDGKKIGEATAGKDGKATITPTVDIPEGNVTAKATDPAGNTSDASDPKVATDTTAPAKPEVKTDLTGKAGTKTPVEVNAEPGSKVELFDKDGKKIGEATAGKDGKTTITPTVEIPAGNVTAKATDPSGNTSNASDPKVATDTTAPAKPVVNTDLTGKAGTKTPVEVNAEPGSKVELFDKDGKKIGEATAGKDGKTTITPTVEIPAGNVTAKATDPSGNTSNASDPKVATDTTAPAKPEVKTDLTGKAGTKTPVEVNAEPGSKVELFDKDGKKIGEATAGKDGKATITPTKDIPAGNVTAKATDPAGNVSEPSEPAKATTPGKDTEAPAKPVVNTDLTGKAGTKTPVEVNAEPGSKVELFDKDGKKIGEATAGKDGKATITPTVEIPEGNVTAKATDPSGNVSEPSEPAKATTPGKDTEAPAKPVVNTDLTGKAGTKTPVEVNAEPGTKVELFDKDGKKIGEATAGKDGKATITPTVEIPEGNVTAKATDPSGNVSEPSEPAKATTPGTEAPAKPVVNTDLTGKAGTKTPVEVNAEPGTKVELFDKDGNKIGEATAGKDGKATITPTVDIPEGNVTAKATDPSGNVSEPSEPAKATTPGKDTEAPAKPVVNTDLTGKAGTKTPVEVNAEPGTKVELFDKDGNKIGEATAGKDGKATITPTVEIPAGNVTAKATDPSGNTSNASDPKVATDTTAPAKPVVNTDLTGKAGTKTPVEVNAEPGSKVELFDKDGKKIGEATAGKDGKTTITPTVEIPAGNVTAKATDPSGNTSNASDPKVATDTTAPAKPEVKTDLTGKAGTKTPVEVNAEPGSKVELFDKDGKKIGEATAGKDGKATITPTKDIPAGNVTAKATDPAGNVSEPSEPAKATTPGKDTEAPAKPVVNTDLTGKAGTKTPVEVNAEPGSKVELFDKDGKKIGEATAGKDGKATITPTVEIPEGNVTAKATDPSGNVSEPSEPAKATTPGKDTEAPAKPVVNTDLTGKAGTKTPVEVNAEPGTKVELFDKDGKKIGEATAGKDGKATITPTVEIPEGNVTAKATDPSGNVSEPSEPAKATTPGTEAPAKPVVNTDLTGKAGTKTPVEVNAEPGTKVELFDKDGNKIGEATAGKDGKATITPTVDIPEGNVTAKATDPSGNVSEPSEPAKATTPGKDTEAPAKPVVNTDLTGKAGTKTPVEVNAEPGTKVELFDKDGNKIGEATAGKDGKATITPTVDIPEGNVTAKATDPSGNVSEPSEPAKATTPGKDTEAPAKPVVNTDLTGKAGTKTPVEVNAEPGTKVELFDKDGKKIGEATAGKDGKATITPTVDIPEGNVTAKATDPAGNTSDASDPKVATDTTAPAKPEVKTDLTGKAGTKTPVEVNAEPGSKVELFDKDGKKIGEATAGKDGKTTITPTVEIPAGNVTAKATDPSGNTSNASDPKVATDTTAPAKPVVNTDLTGKAGTKTPVEVNAEPGSKVELFDKDGKKIGEATAGKDGKTTITPTVEIPAGNVTAKATDPSGNTSNASDPKVATDTTAPAKPEVKTDLTGKAGTKTPVEVNAEPGSKVELFDKDGKKIGEATAGKDGKATITPTKDIPAGNVTAKATDPAGNVSEPSEPAKATTPGKDTEAPAKPVVNTDLTGKAGTKTPVEVNAEPGSKVELFDKDGKKIGEATAGKDGKATITPTVEIPEGNVTAKATDPSGNVSEPSEPAKATTPGKDTEAPAKPVVNTDLTGKAGTKTPVEVNAEPGTKVELFDKDGKKIGEATAGKDGKATITPTVEIPEGNVTAKATDPSGNVSEPSEPAKATTPGTEAPAKPVVNTDLTGKAGTKTPVEVNAEPGTKVELFDKDGNKIGEATAGKDGKATITPTVDIPEGNVTAKATDPSGNVSEPSEPAKATTPGKDTEAPAKPVVNTDLTGKAGTKTPVEVNAEPGTKVELFDKDGNKIGEATAGKDGKATITPTVEIPAGNVTAKATDPSGNTSNASDPKVATDTTAPAKPVVNTDLTGKAGTKTPVEVNAEPGTKVELFDKDGKKIGEATAGKDGKATITPTKDIPAGNVTAKATDPSGNVSEPSDPKVATDTTAPAKPEVKTDLTGKAGTKTPVEVNAEPGSKVELFDKDGKKIGEATAGKDGKATITPTVEIPAGNVTAKATDPAGNTSDASDPKVATDTTAPAKPEVKTDLTGKAGTKTPVEVNAEPGSKVELFDKDGKKIGEATAGKDGKATITPTVDIPEGNVTAKATDPAGNTSDASDPKVATDTTAPAKPEVKTDLTGKAGTKTPVEVNAEPGSKVELFDKDGKKIGEATAGKDGKTTITPTVEIPAGNVTAKATDPSGNTSNASDPKVATDTTAPAKPVVNTDLTGKAGTKTPVEVNAEPGSKVELFDKDGNKIGEATAGKDGKATITPTVDIPEGNVTAKATDPSGNVSEPSEPAKATTPGKDTEAPAKPVVNTDLTGKAGTKTPVEVNAEPGTKVELFDKDGNKIGEATAGKDGKATITPTVDIPEGNVTAKATDPSGNVSEPSEPAKATTPGKDTEAPAKPVVNTDLTGKAGTKTPVEVNAEPGTKVELFDKDGNKIGEATAGKDGKATITPTVEIPEGNVTAKATDPSGNVSEPSEPAKATTPGKDTEAPAKPVVNTDLTGKAGTKTPVEVNAEPGTKVELFDKDGNKIGEATAGKDGKATITPTVEIPEGNVTAKATDPSGNVSEPSEPAKATTPGKDTEAPAKPVVNTDLTGKAGTKTPVEVNAEPGSKVELFDKDGKKIGEATAGKDGKATITPTVEIPEGNVTAKATDPSGNVSEPSEPAKATTPGKDTEAPAKPVVNTDLTGKAGTKTPVEVNAEPGTKVELFDKDGNKIGEATAGKDGKATITPTVEIPEGNVTAKATDPSGNVSEPSEPAKATDKAGNVSEPSDVAKSTTPGTEAPAKLANKSKEAEGVKDPSATPVKDPANLTDAERAKVVEEVKKSNPTATDVKVGKDGTTTVTFPDGSTTVIPADKAVAKAKDSEGVQDPSATAVKDPSNLTDADKAKAASNASQATSAQANERKAAKELPNTGTADSTVAMVAAAASALLGLGLAGRRRKEDEEA